MERQKFHRVCPFIYAALFYAVNCNDIYAFGTFYTRVVDIVPNRSTSLEISTRDLNVAASISKWQKIDSGTSRPIE